MGNVCIERTRAKRTIQANNCSQCPSSVIIKYYFLLTLICCSRSWVRKPRFGLFFHSSLVMVAVPIVPCYIIISSQRVSIWLHVFLSTSLSKEKTEQERSPPSQCAVHAPKHSQPQQQQHTNRLQLKGDGGSAWFIFFGDCRPSLIRVLSSYSSHQWPKSRWHLARAPHSLVSVLSGESSK